MTDWTSQQRRLELQRLLSLGKNVVASDLANEWHCSERTVRRDLRDLRDLDHLPIEYDRVGQTWYYTREVAHLPSMLVDAEDRRALLFSLQVAGQLENTPLCESARRLSRKLLDTLPPERLTRFTRMMQSVRFVGPRLPPIRADVWDVLLLSLEARSTMHITYTDGYYRSKTRRDVDPYGLIMRDRHWLLVAYCHLKEDICVFALHRITSAKTTDKPFTAPANFIDRYLTDSIDGVQSTGQKHKVILRIPKDAPAFVHERRWSDRETRRKDKRGNTLIQFRTAALFIVEREVRAEGGWVQLLQPAEARQRLHESAQKLAADSGPLPVEAAG